MNKTKLQTYINNIAFIIDASGSMSGLKSQIIKVFDNQIKHLQKRSKELDQETRVSIYLFNYQAECIAFDMDVLRMPSLAGLYQPDGNTALIDTSIKAIKDAKTIPELYADRAFLFYVLSDGYDNNSTQPSSALKTLIEGLPVNYTVAYLAPDQNAVHEAKKCGFPAENIQLWSVSEVGLEEASKKMVAATESYMTNRAAGVRGTKTLFQVVDLSNVTSRKVNENLDTINPIDVNIAEAKTDIVIKDFVEKITKKPYQLGHTFYELTKPEKVQANKRLMIQNKISGYIYGGDNARKLLGLPNTEVKLKVEDLANFAVFVQSTSINRKIIKGQRVIVLK